MNNKNLDIQSNRDLFDWIIANKPESEQPAKFYSYDYLFHVALELRKNPGKALSAKDIEEIITGELERIFPFPSADPFQSNGFAIILPCGGIGFVIAGCREP